MSGRLLSHSSATSTRNQPDMTAASRTPHAADALTSRATSNPAWRFTSTVTFTGVPYTVRSPRQMPASSGRGHDCQHPAEPAEVIWIGGEQGEPVHRWLRLHYIAPVTAYYKLTAPLTPPGSYLLGTTGFVGPDGKPAALDYAVPNSNGVPLPPACLRAIHNNPNPQTALPCLVAHGYQGSMTYQPASRFWAFQGIETSIFVVLAAVLIGITFWVLHRRDA